MIKALELQFKITFDASKINTAQKFTGGFPNDNLEKALKLVFSSMDILYSTKDGNHIILASKE